MNRTIIFATFLAILTAACNKEPQDSPNPSIPESDLSISLIYPLNEASIPFNADTSLKVLISDKLSLHEYTIRISDSKDSTMYYAEGHTHKAELYFSDRWMNTAAPGDKLNLVIQASNHKGDILERKFHFFSEL